MAPPLLVIPFAQDKNHQQIHNLCLYSLRGKKPFNNSINFVENLHQDFHCVGSSHEWLAFMHENAVNPFLLSPFSKTRIYLPAKHTLPRIDRQLQYPKIDKLVLCGNPSRDENYAVIVMHSIWNRTMIAFCRRGDEKWSDLGSEIETCYDVVCCDGTKTAFALGPGPTVEAWDMSGAVPSKRMVIIQDDCPRKLARAHEIFPHDLYSTQWYLALSGFGQMFLVVRYIGEFVRYDGEVVYEGDTLTDYASEPLVCPYKTVGFHVFKYDGDGKKWIEAESLDGCAVFVGGNQTTMVSSEELKGNAIYFTDDYWDRMDEDYCYGGHDMGIFNMEDGRIEPVLECREQRIVPTPFWISVPHV